MTTEQEDREQAREKINTIRIIGGLFLIVGLALYYFHQGEAQGRTSMGVLAAILIFCGAALLLAGWVRMRALR